MRACAVILCVFLAGCGDECKSGRFKEAGVAWTSAPNGAMVPYPSYVCVEGEK